MRAQNTLKKTFYAGVLALSIFLLSACGRDYTFQNQWDDGLQKASKIFVENGLCPTHGRYGNECLDKNTLWVTGIPAGFEIFVYGVQDQKLLGQVSEVFIKKFTETPEMKHLIITAYAIPRGHNPNFFPWLHETILNIDMRRNE